MSPFPEINLQSSAIPVTSETMERLDGFLQSLEGLLSDREPESDSLSLGLAALDGLFDVPSAAGCEGRWKAERYADFLGNGAALSLKEQSGVHHLSISRHRDGTLFDGVWARLQGEQGSVYTFNISCGRFILSGEEDEHSCAAPPGADWASPEKIFGFIPDWLVGGLRFAAQALQPPAQAPSARNAISLVEAESGRTHALDGRTTIGREAGNDLRLDDSQLSRSHAVIEPVQDGWQITDLNSTNGVQVNGTRIRQNAPIRPGDEIILGTTRLLVQPR